MYALPVGMYALPVGMYALPVGMYALPVGMYALPVGVEMLASMGSVGGRSTTQNHRCTRPTVRIPFILLFNLIRYYETKSSLDSRIEDSEPLV